MADTRAANRESDSVIPIIIFLISFVIGVLSDPLFLYIPIINEDDKCLRRDERMKNIALIFRSTTDFAYILHIIVLLRSASICNGFPWLYLLTDILAILPLPQVVVVVFFSKMAGSKTLTSRKFLNILLLAQYVPRILRVYLSTKELKRNLKKSEKFSELLAIYFLFSLNFILYIIAGHIFGGFWYFYSTFRETACWHHACNNQNGCDSDSSFYCQSNSISTKNLTYFNQFCPVNPTNSTAYDFGIFANAIESGTLGTTNFPTKFFKCFWWGLRNLSSWGSNLETSSDIWENLFAILILVLGLLLFLYLIGNLEKYLELAREKPKERNIQLIIRKGEELDLSSICSLLDKVEGKKDHGQHESVAEFEIKTVIVKKLEKKRNISMDRVVQVDIRQ